MFEGWSALVVGFLVGILTLLEVSRGRSALGGKGEHIDSNFSMSACEYEAPTTFDRSWLL